MARRERKDEEEDPRAVRPGDARELPTDVVQRYLADDGSRFARIGVAGDGSCFYHSVCVILNKDGYLSKSPREQARIAHAFRCDFQADFDTRAFEYFSADARTGKTFAATRAAMCSPAVWADEVMIKHAAAVLDMNLMFMDTSHGTMYCGVHGGDTLDAVLPSLKKSRLPPSGGAAGGGGTGGGGAAGRAGAGGGGMSAADAAAASRQRTGFIAWVGHAHFEPLVRLDAAADGRIQVTTLFDPAASDADAACVAHAVRAYVDQCGPHVAAAHVRAPE